MARISDAELPARLEELAAPLAAELGLELDEVEVRGQRGSRKVRLIAYTDEGLDIESAAQLSRQVGEVLDEQDLIAGSYTLEVSSPGADRPLRRARDFARNIGRDVRVVRHDDVEGPAETTGTVSAVDDDEITLDAEGAEVRIPLEEIDHGKVVLPW
jgi:ribosome maturation factor RimP